MTSVCPDVRARGSLCEAGMGEELPGVADDGGMADSAVQFGEVGVRKDALPRCRGLRMPPALWSPRRFV